MGTFPLNLYVIKKTKTDNTFTHIQDIYTLPTTNTAAPQHTCIPLYPSSLSTHKIVLLCLLIANKLHP